MSVIKKKKKKNVSTTQQRLIFLCNLLELQSTIDAQAEQISSLNKTMEDLRGKVGGDLLFWLVQCLWVTS